jgi:hypothetical protein
MQRSTVLRCLPRDPCLPAATRHPCRDPQPRRPGGPPQAPGNGGRPPALDREARGVGLIGQYDGRTRARAPSGPGDRQGGHDGLEGGCVVGLAGGQDEGRRAAAAVGRKVNLGSQAAPGPSEGMVSGLADRGPFYGPRRRADGHARPWSRPRRPSPGPPPRGHATLSPLRSAHSAVGSQPFGAVRGVPGVVQHQSLPTSTCAVQSWPRRCHRYAA